LGGAPSWKDGDLAGSFLSNTLLSHESADSVPAAFLFLSSIPLSSRDASLLVGVKGRTKERKHLIGRLIRLEGSGLRRVSWVFPKVLKPIISGWGKTPRKDGQTHWRAEKSDCSGRGATLRNYGDTRDHLTLTASIHTHWRPGRTWKCIVRRSFAHQNILSRGHHELRWLYPDTDLVRCREWDRGAVKLQLAREDVGADYSTPYMKSVRHGIRYNFPNLSNHIQLHSSRRLNPTINNHHPLTQHRNLQEENFIDIFHPHSYLYTPTSNTAFQSDSPLSRSPSIHQHTDSNPPQMFHLLLQGLLGVNFRLIRDEKFLIELLSSVLYGFGGAACSSMSNGVART